MPKELTGKQRLFVLEYVKDLNGTQAARRAGYKGSDNTLASVASDNLRIPKIRAKIDRLLEGRVMEKMEILTRYTFLAEADMADFLTIDQDGEEKIDLQKAEQAGKLHLIERIKIGKKGVEVKLYNKLEALEKLARFRRAWQELNLNIDLTKLNDDQIERLSRGDNPLDVLLNSG